MIILVYLHYFLAFVSGFLVKWVDWIEDDRKGDGYLKFILAIAYGLIIGYLISQASFAELFLGAIIAQIFARKIDNISHAIGFVATIAAMIYFGLHTMDLHFIIYFFILAFLDEQQYLGNYRRITEWRLFTKLGAVALILIGRFDYAIAILLFDSGYILFRELRKTLFPQTDLPPKPAKKKKKKPKKA